MTMAEQLADFVVRTAYEDLSQDALRALKLRVLDSIGCAIGAQDGEPVQRLRAHVDDFGRTGQCSLIGSGQTAPDHAALFNGACVRYLDFNDSYLATGETCHPSDNLAPVLAAAEYARADGRTFLTALAVAYQVQCRLSDLAPVRARGFDHTVQGSYAVAAGVARALGLDPVRTANAIGVAGTAFNALRVTRTGMLSEWKGLAYPNTAFGATHATFLAMRGITGPLEVFEGNKGFMDTIAGRFVIDWDQEDLERVRETIVKKYNAEIHSQSSIEAALALQTEHGFSAHEIERVDIDVFDVAYNIIGGGEEGDKTVALIKEQADHSLHYMVAVALLDGKVMPVQYAPDRIVRSDVQDLLQRVTVRPDLSFSKRFPQEMPTSVRITLQDGRSFTREQADYEGFRTRPASWATVREKFETLAAPYTDPGQRRAIVEMVDGIEDATAAELAGALRLVGRTARR